MLSLNAGVTVNNCIPRDNKYVDEHICSDYKTQHNLSNYIRSKNIEHALTPLIFNGISFEDKTYGIPYDVSDIQKNNYLESINTILADTFNSIPNDKLFILRIYTDLIDEVIELLDKDILKTVPTSLTALYDKCMAQTTLRQELDFEAKTYIRVSRTKHIIVLLSNYDDSNQASDFFLTLGLVPLLFKDFGEKFDEKELNYFRVLVKRSQIKRISNSDATTAFLDMLTNDKYVDMMKELALDKALRDVQANKRRELQSSINNLSNEAQRTLSRYEEIQREWITYNDMLIKLQNGEDDTFTEFKTALRSKHIVDVSTNYDMITLYIKAPLEFYNTDEAECLLHNIHNDKTRRLFEDVFVNQKFILHVMGSYHFRIGTRADLNTSNNYYNDDLVRHGSLFNPHLHFFNCLGDYKMQLIDAQHKQDLLIFVNTAIASMKSINFSDGAVVNRWIDHFNGMFNNNSYDLMLLDSKCLEYEDGKCYSLRDIYINGIDPSGEQAEPQEIDVVDTVYEEEVDETNEETTD